MGNLSSRKFTVLHQECSSRELCIQARRIFMILLYTTRTMNKHPACWMKRSPLSCKFKAKKVARTFNSVIKTRSLRAVPRGGRYIDRDGAQNCVCRAAFARRFARDKKIELYEARTRRRGGSTPGDLSLAPVYSDHIFLDRLETLGAISGEIIFLACGSE